MKIKREFLFLLAVVAIFLVGFVVAQGNGDDNGGNPNPPNDIDSRLVEVEKACTADEISIDGAEANGQGSTCAKAKAMCRSNLAREVRDKAKAECNIYEKVGEEFHFCEAVRGNFNPSKNTKYEPKDCDKYEDGTYGVNCKIKNSVSYTCN